MEKEFVPYELAVKLKALGFDEPCFGYYYTLNGKDWSFAEKNDYYSIDDELNIGSKFSLLAPTLSQAFRWFREKYDLDYAIIHESESRIKLKERLYNVVIYRYYINCNVQTEILRINGKIARYMARENAELACLEKLIEIVENKSEQEQRIIDMMRGDEELGLYKTE